MMKQPYVHINASVLVKADERYILLWDDRHSTQAVQAVANWADNDDLSFSWYDAARLSREIYETNRQTIAELEARRTKHRF